MQLNHEHRNDTGTRAHWNWIFAHLVMLILILVSGTALAQLGPVPAQKSDQQSEKEKAKKEKPKHDDDDDDDDDDKKSEEKVKKSKSKSEERATAMNAGQTKPEESIKAEKASKPKSKAEQSAAKSNPAPAVAKAAGMEEVHATVETDPVPHGGDAADDPAIWIHPTDPAKSTIIGTDKQGGLALYDLSGKQLQYLPDGTFNNVDLRNGFKLGGKEASIVTAGNRKDNSIGIYRVNAETRLLENVAARTIKHGLSIYGSCMYRSAKTGKLYYFANSKSGEVEQWELFESGGKVDAKKVRAFKVGSVVEGCVADDELGHFYLSEEAVGIWKFGAEPEAGEQPKLVDKVGGPLAADVEGLAIAYGPNGTGHLIASSQGNHSYVVYKRDGNNEFVKRFRVADGAVDGAEETDGIDVTTANLGTQFPHGVFVVQDGFNDKGGKNQNFKLVPLQAILKP